MECCHYDIQLQERQKIYKCERWLSFFLTLIIPVYFVSNFTFQEQQQQQQQQQKACR